MKPTLGTASRQRPEGHVCHVIRIFRSPAHAVSPMCTALVRRKMGEPAALQSSLLHGSRRAAIAGRATGSLVVCLLVRPEHHREQHSGRRESDASRTGPAARRGSLNPPREEREQSNELQSQHLLTRIHVTQKFRQSFRQTSNHTDAPARKRAPECGPRRGPDRTIAPPATCSAASEVRSAPVTTLGAVRQCS